MSTVYHGRQVYKVDLRVPQPLLITYRDADSTCKVQVYCDQWAEVEDQPLGVIPNAAHHDNMDNPEQFNMILDEFLLSTS